MIEEHAHDEYFETPLTLGAWYCCKGKGYDILADVTRR
jgi:hypothetical protein